MLNLQELLLIVGLIAILVGLHRVLQISLEGNNILYQLWLVFRVFSAV